MNRPATLGRQGTLPRGLLGMLALVAAVETLIAGHALDFTRFYIYDWAVTVASAGAETGGCGVLCFGDSLAKFGVHPRVIEERLGARAYNLAVCDGQAPSSYFLLRRALRSGARPGAVVVDFAPHLLASGPRHNLRQWPELVDVRDAIDLIWTTKHAGLMAELTLGCVLPTVKDRHEVRGNLVAALRGERGSRRDEVLDHCRAWRLDRGAESAPVRPSYRGEVESTNRGYFPTTWGCHPVNEAYIHRFLRLAEANAIEVFWLLPPVAPAFQARRDELGLEASYTRFLRGLQRTHRNLSVVDARGSGYDHTSFIDPLHLNRLAAGRLTGDVADAIGRARTARAPARWVSLPAVATVPLERRGPRPPTRRVAFQAEAGRAL